MPQQVVLHMSRPPCNCANTQPTQTNIFCNSPSLCKPKRHVQTRVVDTGSIFVAAPQFSTSLRLHQNNSKMPNLKLRNTHNFKQQSQTALTSRASQLRVARLQRRWRLKRTTQVPHPSLLYVFVYYSQNKQYIINIRSTTKENGVCIRARVSEEYDILAKQQNKYIATKTTNI